MRRSPLVVLITLLTARDAMGDEPASSPAALAPGAAAPQPPEPADATSTNPTNVPAPSGPPTARPNAAGFERLRVAIECQGEFRTKVCPIFLLGFVEASPVLMSSPRGTAQVILYATAAPIANDDRLHLRFVGRVRGAPESLELDVDVNTRGTDDEQRAQLLPAFTRGVALYVAALDPTAVKVEITLPSGQLLQPTTTPWGFSVSLDGQGSWTEDFKSGNASAGTLLYRLDAISRYAFEVTASGGLTRRPPVEVDSREVSLDTDEWSVDPSVFANWNLDEDWAIATSAWASHRDPKGQLRDQLGANFGIEWNLFPSDEPRGNVLAVTNFVAIRYDRQNFVNEIGQRNVVYPFDRLSVVGKVRRDTVTLGIRLATGAEALHPSRRNEISLSPSIEWQLGDHVDLAFTLVLGGRELPKPIIPEDDLEALGRAAYAQPLFAESSLTFKVHFDPTNGVRNNRFENL